MSIRNKVFTASTLVFSLLWVGCSNDSGKNGGHTDGGAGQSGDEDGSAGATTGSGGASGKAGSGNGGSGNTTGTGASTGTGGSTSAGGSTSTGGSGGNAGTAAGTGNGGSTGKGGSTGTAGNASTGGASGNAGSGGTSTSEADGGVHEHADIPGPTTDQAPVLVPGGTYVVTNALNGTVSDAAFDSKGDLVLALGSPAEFDVLLKLDPTYTMTAWAIASQCSASSVAGCQVSTAMTQENRGIALGADDSIFFGGNVTDMGPKVAKIAPTGAVVWTKTWTDANAGNANTEHVAAGPNGSIYGWGEGPGQAPGNPPTNTGGNVLVRYEADGTRTFLTQVPPLSNNTVSLFSLLVDGSGNAWVGFHDYGDMYGTPPRPAELALMQLSPAGKLVDTTETTNFNSFERVRFAPDQKSFYVASQAAAAGNVEYLQLYNVDLDGSVNWYRKLHLHTETIDQVEGVTWSGSTPNIGDIRVSKDSIYVIGTFRNTYMNGSNPKPTTNPGFVARLDLDGNQIWFQEFQFGGGAVTAPSDPLTTNAGQRALVTPDDNVVAFFNAAYVTKVNNNQTTTNPLYMLKLKKADGTVIPWN